MHDDDNIKPITLTKLNVTKNKISIATDDVMLMINNEKGGRFTPEYELFMSLAFGKDLIVKQGNAYVSLNAQLKEKYANVDVTFTDKEGEIKTVKADANFILKEMASSKELAQILQDELKQYYIDNVEGVAYIYQHMEDFKISRGL